MPAFLGNYDIRSAYLGGVEIRQMYLGSIRVWSRATFTLDAERADYLWTGEEIRLGRGFVAESGEFDLTGLVTAFDLGGELLAEAGLFSLTGEDVEFPRSVEFDSASFILTGEDIDTSHGRFFFAETGDILLAGSDTFFKEVTVIEFDTGQFVLTGTVTEFVTPIELVAEAGEFTLTGIDATFSSSAELIAETGGLNLTGTDADFLRGIAFEAETQSFALTGNDTEYTFGFLLEVDAGVFTATANDAEFTIHREEAADAGLFTLDGNDVTFTRHTEESANAGAFALTGEDAAFTYQPGSATVEYIQAFSYPVSTSQTVSDVPLPNPSPDRSVIVFIKSFNQSTDPTLTIGGVSMTQVFGPYSFAYVFIADFPTGESADLVITHTDGSRVAVGFIYVAHGLQSTTPVDALGTFGSTLDDTPDASDGGFAIAASWPVASGTTGTITATWGGVTKDVEGIKRTYSGSFTYNGTAAHGPTSSPDINITCSFGGASVSGTPNGIFATFR